MRNARSPQLKPYLWALIGLLAIHPVIAQESDDEPSAVENQSTTTTNLTVTDVLADFDVAWTVISEAFYDPEFRGLDWPSFRDDYRARLEEADDAIEGFEILREMIDALESSATTAVPPWDISVSEDEGADFQLEYGGVGILLRQTVDGEILVLQVFSDTPAEAAGVLVGDLIVGVDEWAVGGDDPMSDVVERVRGIVGTTVNLTLRDPDGGEREVEVGRAQINLNPAVEYRIVSQSTGYLRVPILNEQLVQDASRALPQLLSTRNLILDLRGVRNGGLEQVTTIAQWFLGAAQLGGFLTNGGPQPLQSRTDVVAAYQRPMVILTDGSTYGVAEMLASLLRTYKRAGLVGGTTSGGFEFGRVQPLPSGGLVGVAIARFFGPDGDFPPLEGLTPDVEVAVPDLQILRDGRDVYIEAAIEALQGSPRW